MSKDKGVVDPYEVRKKQQLTWLMCWKVKKDNEWKGAINKDIAIKIAKMIPVDMSSPKWGKYAFYHAGGTNCFLWLTEQDGRSFKPCIYCFFPSKIVEKKFDSGGFLFNYVCLRNHTFQYYEGYNSPRSCCLESNYTCTICANRVAKQNNVILPRHPAWE